MKSLRLFFLLILAVAGCAAPVLRASDAGQSSILYIPHIALASNCNRGYVNAHGVLADVHDPEPANRGIRLQCGWETEVRLRNKSTVPLRIKMELHSSDRRPFRVAYQALNDLAIRDLDSARDTLELDLAPLQQAGYTFSPYPQWEPSWTKRVALDWAEEMFGMSFSPETRNAWMTIEILFPDSDGRSELPAREAVEATATYRFRKQGRIATQVAVGAVAPATQFCFDFHSYMSRKIPWADTGLVITNPNPHPVRVAISIRDDRGQDRGGTTMRLEAKEQLVAMLGILMQLNQDLDGRLTITSDFGPVMAIALQQSGSRVEMTKMDMHPLPPLEPGAN
jgi:hypothetical protein